MKKIHLTLSLIASLLLTACGSDSKDDLDSIITATKKCVFSDFVIEATDSVNIDCLLDLEGNEVTVPDNVLFHFEGGDIFNGTLNFALNGQIDSELLNHDLTIEGDVLLTSNEFQFYPYRWNVIETNSSLRLPTVEEAYNNHIMLQGALDLAEKYGADTFKIDKMNAYFDAFYGKESYLANLSSVINIPSNFNLIMTNNTYIRVFPAIGDVSSKIIRISQATDITIKGGNLIGDRLTHETEKGTGVLINVAGGKRIMIDGVSMSLANSAGINIFGYSNIRNDDYFGSEYVTVQNCTFDSNRTNNLAVTDGQNITIQFNESYRAGNDLEAEFGTSLGLAPRIGIILETQINQYIENVVIKENKIYETWSFQNHSILAVGAANIEIKDNVADKSVGWSTALGVSVTGNTAGGIYGGFVGFNGINNVVSGNTITNEDGPGMFLTDQNIDVFDNDIINSSTAIQLSSLINANIYNNRITSNLVNSIGIIGQHYLDNVHIYNNEIDLISGKSLNIIYVNGEDEAHSGYEFSFTDNIINSYNTGVIAKTHNMSILDNEFTGAGISINNTSNNILVKDNIIISSSDERTFNINNSTNIQVLSNTFNNTNDGFFSLGVTIGDSANSGIVFDDNIIKSTGVNFGMYVTESDNIVLTNNTIENESTSRAPLHFLANDSDIINNIFINNNGLEALIEGSNNTISGNSFNP